MNIIDTLAAKASTLSDEHVCDVILETEDQLAEISADDRAGNQAQSLRLVRAAMLTVLERRYPFLDAILEAWSESLTDDRTYTQVVFDALNAEAVLA